MDGDDTATDRRDGSDDPFRFAEAERADAPELATLINAAYRNPGETFSWTDERGLLAGPRVDALTLLRDWSRGRFLVLRDASDRIVACGHVSSEPDGAGYLSTVAVQPSLQDAGLGRRLLAEAERQAWEAGVRRLRITVIALRTALIAWYERRGYVRTGATVAFPYDDPGVGRALRDDLDLIVLEKPLHGV